MRMDGGQKGGRLAAWVGRVTKNAVQVRFAWDKASPRLLPLQATVRSVLLIPGGGAKPGLQGLIEFCCHVIGAFSMRTPICPVAVTYAPAVLC